MTILIISHSQGWVLRAVIRRSGRFLPLAPIQSAKHHLKALPVLSSPKRRSIWHERRNRDQIQRPGLQSGSLTDPLARISRASLAPLSHPHASKHSLVPPARCDKLLSRLGGQNAAHGRPNAENAPLSPRSIDSRQGATTMPATSPGHRASSAANRATFHGPFLAIGRLVPVRSAGPYQQGGPGSALCSTVTRSVPAQSHRAIPAPVAGVPVPAPVPVVAKATSIHRGSTRPRERVVRVHAAPPLSGLHRER